MGLLRRVLDATGYRSALRHRDVRLLLGSQAISDTGNWSYNVGLVTYIYGQTHSLGWVGAASTLRFVPGIVLSPYGGVIAERFERRRVMTSLNMLALVWQAGLCVVASRHGPAAVAIGLAVVNAATLTPYEPCVAATIPAAAGEADLPAANALVHTVENLVILVGPALGAVLLLLFSPALVFAVNGLSFAVAAVLVSQIGVRSIPVDVTEGGTAGLRAQLAVGFRAVVSSKRIAILVGGTALTSFLFGIDTVQLVGVATERIGAGARAYGWLLGAMGLGGLVAAAAVDRITRRPRVGGLIVGGITAMCVPTLLLVVVRDAAAVAALEAVRGAGMLVVDVLATIALQRSVAPEQLGRVFGVLWAIILTSIALGAAIISPLIHAVGLVGSLWVVGLVPLALTLAIYPMLRGIDEETAAAARAVVPRINLLRGSPLFAVADPLVVERLAAASVEHDVPAGTEVVREGEPADALYLLAAGSAEASTIRGRGEGARRVLGRIQAGTVFGEIGLLDRVPRTATVTVLEPSHLLRIDGDTFLEALTDDPFAALVFEIARARRPESETTRRTTDAAPVP